MSMIIRRARENDIPRITDLLLQVHKVHSDKRPDIFKRGSKKYNEEELAEIAITMQQATGKTFSVEEVRERLIRELQRAHTMDEYLSYIGYLGRRVTLILGDERIPATLVSVETDGKLRAETENGERLFSSAEVSLRI